MNDKEKQIEEITREFEYCQTRDCQISCARCRAEYIVEQNYRKIPENAVVLTREEYEMLAIEYKRWGKLAIEDMLIQSRKETAREFATTLISVIWEEEKDETIRIKDLHGVIRDVANAQYGVDLEV